jgi:hypothetical protein
MSKSPATEPATTEENVAPASRKREFTAVAAATTVSVVLGVASNILVGKVAAQVSNRINPPPKTESTTN